MGDRLFSYDTAVLAASGAVVGTHYIYYIYIHYIYIPGQCDRLLHHHAPHHSIHQAAAGGQKTGKRTNHNNAGAGESKLKISPFLQCVLGS